MVKGTARVIVTDDSMLHSEQQLVMAMGTDRVIVTDDSMLYSR